MTETVNLDPREAGKFNRLAARWWDPQGDLRTLHDINGPRVEYIAAHAGLAERMVIDVGCGGGLLSEALAARGARVTGLDAADKAIAVARLHLHESGWDIDYRHGTAEAHAAAHPERYAVTCCLELLEHVPEPASTVSACAAMTVPGGDLFFSTINRTPRAWLTAIVGAEYVLRLLPKGTHRYDRLIRPSELAGWCRAAGLEVVGITGLSYQPWTRTVHIGGAPAVNYFLHARKPR